jgi:nucleotide-binding universal stress UspA family protein
MARALGYRKILVPIGDNAESEKAMDVACRLAEGHGAAITVVAVVEVPPTLPLDSHMRDEEASAHRLLERGAAIADSYGVSVAPRMLRGRDAASGIVRLAELSRAQIIVIGAPRKARARTGAAVFGDTVEHVLKKAPCRVMVIGTGAGAAEGVQSSAA